MLPVFERKSSADFGNLCVSHPVSKGYHRFHLVHRFTFQYLCCRGPAHDITTLANEASDVMGCGQRRLTVYLQRTCCSRCPILLLWFHGGSCYSPQTFLPQQLPLAVSPASVASLQMCANHLFKHLQLIGLLTLPLSHSFPLELH